MLSGARALDRFGLVDATECLAGGGATPTNQKRRSMMSRGISVAMPAASTSP